MTCEGIAACGCVVEGTLRLFAVRLTGRGLVGDLRRVVKGV